jgi:hypothetical protein
MFFLFHCYYYPFLCVAAPSARPEIRALAQEGEHVPVGFFLFVCFPSSPTLLHREPSRLSHVHCRTLNLSASFTNRVLGFSSILVK